MGRAAFLTTYDEPLAVRERERPEPTADGIVVETAACGICRSDWHGWKGHWPGTPPEGHVLGHEPAGTVVAAGDDVESVTVGDSVGVPFTVACGQCPHCWEGQSQVCETGLSLGFSPDLPGAFATEFAIPRADFNVTPLPDGMDPLEMAALGCRYATAFHALAHRADVEAGDWLAVHGCGGVGLSAVQIAAALGANVVAVDLTPAALSLAERAGASETLRADETDDVPGAVAALTDGGADVSVDALGISETCRNSVACLDTHGQHVQVGMTSDGEDGDVSLPMDAVIADELDLLGVTGMPPHRYDDLLAMIAGGKLDPAALVTAEVGLDDVSDRLRAMDDFGTVGIEVVTEF